MENRIKETKTRAFSSFETAKDFIRVFQTRIVYRGITPGESTSPLEPSSALVEFLRRAGNLAPSGEQALRAGIIYPILSEVVELFKDKISFFFGVKWETDVLNEPDSAGLSLSGICDFILGGFPYMRIPEAPMICVVEAKKEDMEGGTWQCAAELSACKMNNERAGLPYPFYFGCITTGKDWSFIRLNCEENILYCDSYTYFPLKDLPQLLGVWKWVLETQLAAAPPQAQVRPK